jgi:hypothetical protein
MGLLDQCIASRRARQLTVSVVILGALLVQACSVEQPVSGPVALTGDWKTIEPPEPLRIGQKEQQKFCLQVGKLRDLSLEHGVSLDDGQGQRHVLEGEAVDSEGTRYALKLAEAGGDHICLYRAGEPISGPNYPPERTIVKLRLRSDPPLQVGGIRWYSYDQT